MNRIVPLALISFFLFCSGIAQAEDETDTALEPIIVEASRVDADYRKIPAAVEVMTSDTLETAAKSGNFYDAIKNMAGVHTDHGSGMGWPTIKVRGEAPTVLVNGMNINPYITASPFSILSADMDAVERIEVLKGSQAATQGSGAMSGAINVVMKEGSADDPYMKVRLGGGSNDTIDESFTLSGGRDKMSWFLNYAQKNSGNYETPLGRISYTDSEYRNFYGHFNYLLDDQQEISIETIHSDGEYRTGGENYYYINDGSNNKIWQNEPESSGVFVKYSREFTRVDIDATAGYMANSLDYVYGDAPYDILSFEEGKYKAYTDEDYYMADIRATAELLRDDLLGLHLDYSHKTTEASVESVGGYAPFQYDSTEHLNSFVAQLESRPTPYLLLLAGIRHDMYDRDGETEDKSSPNAGISIYPFAETAYNWTTLWASYSESFKMPSANYLHLPSVMGGNPDLKPEESEGWEIGIKQQLSGWGVLNISYFYTDYRNRIVFDLSQFKLDNIGQSSGEGYEVQLEIYPTENLTLYTNYLDMERIDEETDERTYSSPNPDSKWVFGALLRDFHGFNFSIEGTYYIDFKLDEDEAHPSEHQVVLDSRISYDLYSKGKMAIEPYIELNNITDEEIYCAGDTPGIQPGITFFAGVKSTYHF